MLVARDQAVDTIVHCMKAAVALKASEDTDHPKVPLLMATGCPGTGKSCLLDNMGAEVAKRFQRPLLSINLTYSSGQGVCRFVVGVLRPDSGSSAGGVAY